MLQLDGLKLDYYIICGTTGMPASGNTSACKHACVPKLTLTFSELLNAAMLV